MEVIVYRDGSLYKGLKLMKSGGGDVGGPKSGDTGREPTETSEV